MNALIQNYALLIASAAPVLTLAAMNLFLAFAGERGTLLMPSAGPLEAARRAANRVPAGAAPAAGEAPANDPEFRRVA